MEDDETISVSKGVFVFKNNFKTCSKSIKRKRKIFKPKNSHNPLFSSNLWYEYYYGAWDFIEEQLSNFNYKIFSSVLSNLVDFIKDSHNDEVEEIPTAALFTGINMPDHGAQFDSLLKRIKETTTPHVACLQSQDCQNIKYFMENMIDQFVNEEDDGDEDILEGTKKPIKKNQLNLLLLECWYEDLYKETDSRKPLVVIIPDFESFNPLVLQKFIRIISWYIKRLPFVLVFGIATDINTLHKSLPYKVTSKIRVKIFHSQKSIEYLNNVLDEIFFSDIMPFRLGGNVFNLFIELFLFYDLSVNNFIQNMKYAMADHFTNGNAMILCTLDFYNVEESIDQLSREDFETIKQLPSFKKLVTSLDKEEQIKVLVDDDYFCKILFKKICSIQNYIKNFHLVLKCLKIFVEDLPRAPLGKTVRELYAIATTTNITRTADYKECIKLLSFLSKDELDLKLSKVLEILSTDDNEISVFSRLLDRYRKHLNNLDDYKPESTEVVTIEDDSPKPVELKSVSRVQFRENLLKLTKTPNKELNKYEKLRSEIIETISHTFEKYLKEPESHHLHEIFFYNDMSIKNYIIGSHRSAIHNALNDPQFYLRCDCCEISNSAAIKPTMPDISIAYKLHLEYGKMINLYDWLQSFISIVDPEVDMNDDAAEMVVRPEMQYPFCIIKIKVY